VREAVFGKEADEVAGGGGPEAFGDLGEEALVGLGRNDLVGEDHGGHLDVHPCCSRQHCMRQSGRPALR
jgi:hypothetical protein